MTKETLLDELRERLDRLDCLCRPVKQMVFATATQIDANGIREYLDETLSHIEQQIGSIDHAGFSELCQRMSSIDDFSTIREALRIAAPTDDWRIFGFGVFMIDDNYTTLYCLANHIAVRSVYDVPPVIRDDLSRMLPLAFAHAAYAIGKEPGGCQRLEDHLGLSEQDYIATDFNSALRDKLDAILPKNSMPRVLYVQALAYALWTDGRQWDSARILDAHLDLPATDSLPSSFDELLRERWEAIWDAQESVAYPARKIAEELLSSSVDEFRRHGASKRRAVEARRKELLNELRSRLDALVCICRPMKQRIIEVMQSSSESSLAYYLEHVQNS